MKKTICRVIGVIGILLVAAAYLPLSLPGLFGWNNYVITSGSMEPEIPTGSLVYAREADPSALETGDVIVFDTGPDSALDTVVTHRVVKNDPVAEQLITKGDANETEDLRPVAYADVIGLVKCHIPLMGYAALLLNTLQGKLGAAAVLIAAVLLYLAGSRRKADPSETSKKGE